MEGMSGERAVMHCDPAFVLINTRIETPSVVGNGSRQFKSR